REPARWRGSDSPIRDSDGGFAGAGDGCRDLSKVDRRRAGHSCRGSRGYQRDVLGSGQPRASVPRAVIRHRSVGLVGVLPVYVALATALGFVDFRVRTHHERDLAYTASVVAGTEEPPGRYRILAPYAFDGLTRLTRL